MLLIALLVALSGPQPAPNPACLTVHDFAGIVETHGDTVLLVEPLRALPGSVGMAVQHGELIFMAVFDPLGCYRRSMPVGHLTIVEAPAT